MTILKYERISFQGLLKMLARHTKPSAFLFKPPTLSKVQKHYLCTTDIDHL